jgi:hypothetical protein
MTPFETLLVVFSVLIIGGTSYELYNETKSHHISKHKTNYRSSNKYHNKKDEKSNNDFFGLFKKSRKSKGKSNKLSERASRKLTPQSSKKLFNIFKDTLENKGISRKLRSEKRRKHTSSMTSSERRQYYLNKFKNNVHKTKKRRRRVYI